MKKLIKRMNIVIIAATFALFFFSNTVSANQKPSEISKYKSKDYVIDKYDIDIKVNENNTFDITETIEAYFNVPKHGIFRIIPLTNNVVRLDGTSNKNRATISNLEVNDNYSTSREKSNYKIEIGSANTMLTGKKKYKINYNYNIGKDKSENYDEFYYNIIGDGWETAIGNVTFKITMPKDFDQSKIGFSSGSRGSTDSSDITYIVKNNEITGEYNGILNAGEALTVRIELPDGYFVDAGYQMGSSIYLFFAIPAISLLVSFILWKRYGKDDEVIETVEFYPPEGFNSMEVGFLYKGRAENKDVTSLLIYLANKGYIKITETQGKGLFDTYNSFEITKIKEYDGDNVYEKEFLDGLFKCKIFKGLSNSDVKNEEQLLKVTSFDLCDVFYKTMNKILKNVNSKTNRKKIFEKTTSSKSFIIILMIIITLLTIFTIPTLAYAGITELIITLAIALFYVPFYAIGLSNMISKGIKIFWLGFTMVHSFVFLCALPIMSALMQEIILLVGFLFGVACLIGMIVCLKAMPKRTKYGNEMLGRLRGFKNYLETAEKDKLESMVMREPTYFYDILPFTYVLGVSDKWIKKFENINMQTPTWYDSPSGFDTLRFTTFISSTMKNAERVMSSSPSSSGDSGSSGGFSGGGSSGGGSGGGGGGSW